MKNKNERRKDGRMFSIDEGMTVYLTRGDAALLPVSCKNSEGETYTFRKGDILTLRVFKKRRCEDVVLKKDVAIVSDTDSVEIYLSSADTRIGDIINGPVDYWYEVELNSGSSSSQTVIGYDRDGPKIFRLYPEGGGNEMIGGTAMPSVTVSEALVGYVLDPEVVHGRSAYEIALLHGFEGSEEEWLASLGDRAATEAINSFGGRVASAITGYVTGTVVTVDDVSPLTHKVKVTVTGVSDGTEVTVKSCGKNLFDISRLSSSEIIINNGNGTMTVKSYSCTSRNTLKELTPNLKTGDTVVFSFVSDNANSYKAIYLTPSKKEWAMKTALTITQEMLDSTVVFYGSRTGPEEATLSNIQFELGATVTAYEPYIEGETVSATVPQEVELTPIAPCMTINTDNANAVVEASYNKDTNIVIEKLTQAIISLGGNI